MNRRDPLEALNDHYDDRSALGAVKFEAQDIVKKRTERSRQRASTAAGVLAGVAAAAFLLTWSARPLPVNAAGAAMIERAQMINAGLVRRDSGDWRIR